MRLNTLGTALYGSTASHVFVDGVQPTDLSGFTPSTKWTWIDDTHIGGIINLGAGDKLYSVVTSTGVATVVDSFGGISVCGGGGVLAAFNTAAASKGVRTNVGGFGPFSLAGLGDTDETGLSVFVQNYASDFGLNTFSAAGTSLQVLTTQLTTGYIIRARNGIFGYQAQGGHIRNITTGVLQAYAPQTTTPFEIIPVTISGSQWVVEWTNANLVLRPATSGTGFVIASPGSAIFNPDAVELSPGIVRIGWCVNTAESQTSLRLADVNTATAAFSLGTTAGGGAPVFTTQPNLTQSSVTVGPVEGGSLSATKQPRHAIKDDAFVGGASGKRVYQQYWDQVGGQAVRPADLTQATGVIDPAHGGTGVTTGLSVLAGQNIIAGSTPLTALEDETESTLIGRGQGAGDGAPEEITLGAGLTMTGTVLSAPAGSGTVTNTGTLTDHALIVGNGGVDVSALASLGTTTTVLHGDAAGDPTFGPVSLTADVSGDLPYANLQPATAASFLLGRGSAGGAGDWQEITLGSNLTMTGTVLDSTGGGGGGCYIPMVDGSEPPNFITDGAGVLILVAYP